MFTLAAGLIALIVAHAASAPTLVVLVGGTVTLAAGLGGIAGFHAYKNAAAGWKEERDAAVAKADRLEGDLDSIRGQIAANQSEISALRAKDTTKLYDLMVEHHGEMLKAATRVQTRDEQLAYVIAAIANAVIPSRTRRD